MNTSIANLSSLILTYPKLAVLTFFFSIGGHSRPIEPQKIEPLRDRKFIESLNLSVDDWNDSVINLIIVGQDARAGVFSNRNYIAEDHSVSKGLASRADGNLILSMNKSNGQISIFSIYRGIIVPDEFWQGVTDTPSEKTERYLANYYTFAGRTKYIEFIRQTVEKLILKNKTIENSIGQLNYVNLYMSPNNRGSQDKFKIHGLIETEFSGFKAAFVQFLNYRDAFTALTLANGQMKQMITIAANKTEIFKALSINTLSSSEKMDELRDSNETSSKNKSEDSSTILIGLRERKTFSAGGYQRAFNHAKFIATLLGYFGFAMAESDHNLLRAETLKKGFSILSRTFSLQDFEDYLRLANGQNIITKAGFVNGFSPVFIHQLGYSFQSHLTYFANRKALSPLKNYDSMLGRIDETIKILPNASNCGSCR